MWFQSIDPGVDGCHSPGSATAVSVTDAISVRKNRHVIAGFSPPMSPHGSAITWWGSPSRTTTMSRLGMTRTSWSNMPDRP